MARIKCGAMTFAQIEAVIFDKDGTLANSEAFLRNLALRRSRLIDAEIPGVAEPLLMALGLEENKLNPGGLMAVGSRWESKIAAAAYVAETGRDWIASLEIVGSAFAEADRYMQRKALETPIFAGVAQLLESLWRSGVKVGIVSSDITENVKDFVETYDLESYVTLQMGVLPDLHKPDPKVFQEACRQLEVGPERTLMVGDSQADFDMGKAAGAAGVVGVSWGWTSALKLEKADVAIAQLDEMQVVR